MNDEFLDKLKSNKIEQIVSASENPEESIRQLSNQLTSRVKQLNQEYWERCRFCECGADSLKECACDIDKRKGYRQRTKRKVNDDIGKAPYTILLLSQEYDVDLSKQDLNANRGENLE